MSVDEKLSYACEI